MTKRGQERVVIVGAGLAGASTAARLSETGDREIVIIDKERLPGMHSSGRNAAMIRQVVRPGPIARLARDGARYLAENCDRGDFRFEINGSLLLGARDQLSALLAELDGVGALAPDCRLLGKQEIELEIALLEELGAEAGIWTPGDGVVDVAALLEHYLREARHAGVELRLGTTLIDVDSDGGRIRGIQTDQGYEPCDVLVNAAGPWVGRVAEMVAATAIPWRPLRRHLFFTGTMDEVDPSWPFAWDIEREWYMRPESGGLLLCAGDESEVEPGEPDVDPSVTTTLMEKIEERAPALAEVPIARVWAGLRTFAPDRGFVIGWDAEVAGFFWVAGLGGHGVTTSSEVGRMAARLIVGKGDALDADFAPDRFA